MNIDITPVSKPRMVRSDQWSKRPAVLNYWAYKHDLNNKINGAMAYHTMNEIPDCHHITFYMPMPKSWSKKKKEQMNKKPHKQRPDLDNLVKGFWDAVFPEDSHIWDCRATKRWSYEGGISIASL
jgi:Holliday junction resolvase RusA-like endonuclease